MVIVFFKEIFIGVKLLHNTVLVSVVQQSESAMCKMAILNDGIILENIICKAPWQECKCIDHS